MLEVSIIELISISPLYLNAIVISLRERNKRKYKRKKKAVAVAKAEAASELYEELETVEGQKKIYRIAKYRNKATKDRCDRSAM